MHAFHPEYVVDEHQQTRSVLLPFHEWQEILNAMEELEDIHVYDQIKKQQLQFVPFDQAVQEIRGTSV